MVVAGLGVSGRAAAEVLASRGARVVPVDDHADDVIGSAELLEGTVLDRADLVVASPGLAPHHPLLVAAREHDVPVWSEVELAWHVRVDRAAGGGPAPWLAVTGTNGKTTTVGMLESILRAAGENAAAVGNVGTPVVLAATDPTLDVLAVELSSFQLHHTSLDVRAGGRGAQRRTRPPGLARVARRLRRRQGPHLRARPGGVRVQPRRPRHRGPGPGGGRRRRLRRRRLHASARRWSDRSAWSRTCWSTAGSRGSGTRTRPSWARSTTWRSWPARTARCRRTSSRTRWRPPRSRSRTASHPAAVREGLRAYGPGEHRLATRRRGRRRRLRGRLEGDERARGRRGPRSVPGGQRRVGRGRPGQGRAVRRARRRPARPPAGRGADRRRPRTVARRARPTRTRGPRGRGRRR